MTALCVIRMAGGLSDLKPVFIALLLHSGCEMLGSRENPTSKCCVILTPFRVLYMFLVTISEDQHPYTSNIIVVIMSALLS